MISGLLLPTLKFLYCIRSSKRQLFALRSILLKSMIVFTDISRNPHHFKNVNYLSTHVLFPFPPLPLYTVEDDFSHDLVPKFSDVKL